MNFFKRLIPNQIKQRGKYFLLDLLDTPYSRSGAPLEILKWLPKSKPITFFDIGASVGHFSLSLCGEYAVEKAILVEPVAKLIPILREKFPNAEIFTIINAAIADTNSEADFYIDKDFDSVSSLLRIFNEGDELANLHIKKPVPAKIKTFTLDHITDEQHLLAIDLIKIDVQGAEHLVLKSGIETLKKTKLVYTEFSFKPLYENSSVFADLYKTFYENDFMLADLNRGYASANGELLQGDALFVNKALMN